MKELSDSNRRKKGNGVDRDPLPPIQPDVDETRATNGSSEHESRPRPDKVDRASADSFVEDELDAEGERLLAEIEDLEPEAKANAARELRGTLLDEIDECRAELGQLGSNDYLTSIKASRWYPHSEMIQRGSDLAWKLDGVFWSIVLANLWQSIAETL